MSGHGAYIELDGKERERITQDLGARLAKAMRTPEGVKAGLLLDRCEKAQGRGELGDDEAFVLTLVGYGPGNDEVDLTVFLSLRATPIVEVAGKTQTVCCVLHARSAGEAGDEALPHAQAMQQAVLQLLVEKADPAKPGETRNYGEPALLERRF